VFVKWPCSLALISTLSLSAAGVVFEGTNGPGRNKSIVLVSGDEEYRSEEALPQLARILSAHYGFKCIVLFALDPEDGTVNPEVRDNIPGLEALEKADLLILFIRFRDLPDDQMKHIAAYVDSGKPIIGMRTATHAFAPEKHTTYRRWHWNESTGGFGRMFLGETWVAHHGTHLKQSTRGMFASGSAGHPILRGIRDGEVWGPTDVYAVHPTQDSHVLLLGQVLVGMSEQDAPVDGAKNKPMMPIAWTRNYTAESGKSGRIFTTTMGSSQDMQNEAFRRMLVNAAFWGLGLERKIPKKANVDLVGTFVPSPFGFGGHRRGRKPEDF
jgi:type 1 glutamine amidotransferase